MPTTKFVYVAGPYSSQLEAQRRTRLERVKATAERYARRGYAVIPWWTDIDPAVEETPEIRGAGIEVNCRLIRRMVAAVAAGLASDVVFVVVGYRSAGVQVELDEYMDACREYGVMPELAFEEV